MSLQDVAWVVGITLGIATIIKIALDIATSPKHRDTGLVLFLISLRIGFELLPMALVVAGLFLAQSIGLRCGLIYLGVLLATLKFSYWEPEPPRRVETAYLILFVSSSFFVTLILMLIEIADRISRD